MKLKFLIAPALFGVASVQVSAQDFGANKDECLQNLSLMGTFYKEGTKTKDFSQAVAPFEYVYQNCPKSSQNVYVQGAAIVKWQMDQASDVATKTKYFDKLMKLYDDRIKYFSKKKPAYYIRGRKAYDYVLNAEKTSYKTSDPLNTNAYKMFKQSVEEGEADNELLVFQQMYLLSKNQYEANKANSTIREQYVNDYLLLTKVLSDRVANGSEADSTYDQLKGAINYDFGVSGAADYKQMDGVYASQVDAHKSDKEWLNNVLSLYDMVEDAEKSTVYSKISKYMYAIEPTYRAASGLAAEAQSKGDINGAITYYNQACNMATSKSDKSAIMVKVAALYFKQKNFQQVRSYAQKALSYNSSNGMAYIYIGLAYASSSASISSDPFVQRYAFWAAVDKFEKAKAVDANCAGRANAYINSYKQYFPDKKEGFMRKVSGTVTVPGWINETTTVRFK